MKGISVSESIALTTVVIELELEQRNNRSFAAEILVHQNHENLITV